jgi:mRNA-degrading endonuclease RelE of RelBE toxin-antitoxin system
MTSQNPRYIEIKSQKEAHSHKYCMNGFRIFFESKVHDEAQTTLEKLPKGHRDLIKDYKFDFQTGVNLKGYPDSIGIIHLGKNDKQMIKVASPWRYPTEFALLHEIAHKIYEKLVSEKLRKEWSAIVKKVRPDIKKIDKAVGGQDDEEIFAHSYAQFYTYNKMSKFDHGELQDFISKLPKSI